MRGTSGRWARVSGAAALAAFGALSWSGRARAVRPFVTDDARISDVGQLELEAWPDLVLAGGHVGTNFNVMFGASFTEWMQVIAGGGFGVQHDGQWTVTNPVVQPKILLWRAADDGVPGLALGFGVTLPLGVGDTFEDATGLYAIAMLTSRLYDDWLVVHFNVGARAAIVPEHASHGGDVEVIARPYWGFGLDIGFFHPNVRLIAESYAGDPFEALGPDYAFQWGYRWLANDYLNFDVTLGMQPLLIDRQPLEGRWETWMQVGVRVLADVLTRGRGDPQGARGLVPPFRAHGR
ncbi:MAG: hypothetical protein KF729_20105 [Sandaracinaceae bacterium]|nr:hypothetical protein [Sandaracinaceae bacterium]